MKEYTLKHPKCGAKWQAEYDKAPKEVQCIECGQIVQGVYDPVIYVAYQRRKGYEY